MLKVNPRSVPAQMLLGLVLEGKGDVARARQAYEKVLELNPRFPLAANNLAILYFEHGGDKEKALALAQTAREAAPEDPHIADTLGWMFYQRGVYQRAIALLKESVAKLPNNPEIQYHLGMAALKVGDNEAARKALTVAANSPTRFGAKDEAKRALAELK
jgi:Flp pilus assembly protein TadD